MTTILAKQQRQPGTIDSGDVSVAGQVQQTTNYIFTALMDAADIADPTLVIQLQLFLDAQLVYDATWTGGARDKNNIPISPVGAYATGSTLPTTVRGTMTLPRRISIGMDLTLGSILR